MSTEITMDGKDKTPEGEKRYMSVATVEAMSHEIQRKPATYKGLDIEELEWDFGNGPQVGLVRVPFEKTVLPDGKTPNPIVHAPKSETAWNDVYAAFEEYWKKSIDPRLNYSPKTDLHGQLYHKVFPDG